MSKKSEVQVGSFEATFRDLLLPFGLRVDAVKLAAQDVKVGQHPFKLNLAKSANVLATVSQGNLSEFLNKEKPGGLNDFEVKLEAGKLYVSATAKVVFDIRANAICSLDIRDGKEVWIVLETVDMLGVGAKGLVEKQLEKINPILDTEDFPFEMMIEKITISEGELILIGTANLSE
ncbi:MAG TPA: LmeA family phospholipid-binding protein [Fimbriimonadaceae bacterium]|jgi:hypothetical protein